MSMISTSDGPPEPTEPVAPQSTVSEARKWRNFALAWGAVVVALLAFDIPRAAFVDWTRGVFADLGNARYLVAVAVNGFANLIFGAIPFIMIEWLSQERGARISFLRALRWPLMLWVAYFTFGTLAKAIGFGFRYVTGIGSLEAFTSWPLWAQLIVYALLLDFFHYWFHRLEHRVPFLWRFHSTHHSIENLSALNSVNHWFESAFRFFGVLLPTTLILPYPDGVVQGLALIWATWVHYIHSDAKVLQMPRALRFVFVDNLFHHYHHGRERAFHDSNFGDMLSIWDHLFGTATMPEGDAFPDTGVEGLPPPRSFKEYALHPFWHPKA